MMQHLTLFCLFLACACAQDIAGPETQRYPFIMSFSTHNYYMYWDYNATHITVETHCKTRGYTGFGFSATGRMYPGDLAIGYVSDDGQGHLYDYHTFSHNAVLDGHQDWQLLGSREDDRGTMLKFTRQLDTHDAQDWSIHPDENMYVIWAFSDSDLTDPHHPGPNHGKLHSGYRHRVMVYSGSAVGK